MGKMFLWGLDSLSLTPLKLLQIFAEICRYLHVICFAFSDPNSTSHFLNSIFVFWI